MYFIYKIEWSQTDQDTVIVKADNKEAAYKKVKAAYPGAFYWQYIAETKTMIQLNAAVVAFIFVRQCE